MKKIVSLVLALTMLICCFSVSFVSSASSSNDILLEIEGQGWEKSNSNIWFNEDGNGWNCGGALTTNTGIEYVLNLNFTDVGNYISKQCLNVTKAGEYKVSLYKRFCDLLIASDLIGYDLHEEDPELFDLMNRTYMAEKEVYFNPHSGRQMGYGQGYLTQAAIMLDRYDDLTDCIEAISDFCYHHTDHNYIVPEGVIMHGSGRYWFRNSDLGNAVQQAESVKCARLLLGIDDIVPSRGIRFVPRIPNGWDKLEVSDFPIICSDGVTRKMNFEYTRTTADCSGLANESNNEVFTYSKSSNEGYKTKWEFEFPVDSMRVGPFKNADIVSIGAEINKIEKIQDNYFAYLKI